MSKSANLSDLRRYSLRMGLDIAKHAPGDGVARYRVIRVLAVRLQEGQELPAPPAFHSDTTFGTFKGIGEVSRWIDGFASCYYGK